MTSKADTPCISTLLKAQQGLTQHKSQHLPEAYEQGGVNDCLMVQPESQEVMVQRMTHKDDSALQ